MVFSSPLFLFLFLPLVLTVNALLPGVRAKNFWLLLMSLAFYAWGEVAFILLLLASTLVNYGLGLWVDRSRDDHRRKLAVGVAVCFNIGVLAFFKYADLVVHTLNSLLSTSIPAPHIPLPIGISFFTFHALSYVIDVYRRKQTAARDPKDVALYIFFFPQLVAGPILRWSAIAPQLIKRQTSRPQFAEGIRRFTGGLAKKMIVANAVAVPADQIFALSAAELSAPVAWFGILCYSIQIYFDFSGYSDMAVGLGKMFGFQFLENFQFPYISQSVRDFWRRWHISLSTWFRDYVYIPMGGNRVSAARNGFNLVVVFFLCGLWHGASWTFVVWGIYHGVFLVLERTRFGEWEDRLPRILRHIYTLFVVMMGWVFFKADSFAAATHFFTALSGLATAAAAQPLARYATNQALWGVVLGLLFSGPLWGWLKAACARLGESMPSGLRPAVKMFGAGFENFLVVVLLLISAAWLAGDTYNPFIYFRF